MRAAVLSQAGLDLHEKSKISKEGLQNTQTRERICNAKARANAKANIDR